MRTFMRQLALAVTLTTAVSLAFVAANTATARALDADNCYGLLMGSSYFPDGGGQYGPIPVDQDIEVWRHLLVDQLGWLPSHITILRDEQFTREGILGGIRSLKMHDSPDSVFLILLATHGWTALDTRSPVLGDEDAYDSGRRQGHDPWDEFLFPFDGDARSLANIIYDDELALLFDQLDFAGRVVLVSCTCCGGGLVEDIARPGLLALAVCDSDRHEMHWWEAHNLPAYALGYPDMCLPSYLDVARYPQLLCPDTDADGLVSVEEAFAWAVLAQTAASKEYMAHGGGPCAQYMYDGIPGDTHLRVTCGVP